MTITRRVLLAAPALLTLTPAMAQAGKITLVVPFPPGGSTDAMARLLQANLQTKLNRIVVVENKSGAAGCRPRPGRTRGRDHEGNPRGPLPGLLRQILTR